jgi:hypothetical protein
MIDVIVLTGRREVSIEIAVDTTRSVRKMDLHEAATDPHRACADGDKGYFAVTNSLDPFRFLSGWMNQQQVRFID